VVALAASGLLFAQNQSPIGGWRRVGDPPPASPSASSDPQLGQNPEPVDRSDAYGQPMETAPQTPQMTQSPATQPLTAPATSPSTTRSAYGLPAELILKPGTYISIRTGQALSTDHNQLGDTFVAHLSQPVIVDGVVVAPRNATVYGRVEEVQKQSAGRSSRLGLQLTSLILADGTQLPIESLMITRTGTSTPGGVQAGTVAATTGIGAAIGGAVGWGTGAAIGAGAGAAAGLAGVLLTRNHPTIVYPESLLTFTVTAPVKISTERTPQAFRFVGPGDDSPSYNAQLQQRPAPRPGYYGSPYGYAPAPAPYPYVYAPYPYWGWGPSFGVVVGRGWGWGRWR
jgi:hypothetical protein